MPDNFFDEKDIITTTSENKDFFDNEDLEEVTEPEISDEILRQYQEAAESVIPSAGTGAGIYAGQKGLEATGRGLSKVFKSTPYGEKLTKAKAIAETGAPVTGEVAREATKKQIRDLVTGDLIPELEGKRKTSSTAIGKILKRADELGKVQDTSKTLDEISRMLKYTEPVTDEGKTIQKNSQGLLSQYETASGQYEDMSPSQLNKLKRQFSTLAKEAHEKAPSDVIQKSAIKGKTQLEDVLRQSLGELEEPYSRTQAQLAQTMRTSGALPKNLDILQTPTFDKEEVTDKLVKYFREAGKTGQGADVVEDELNRFFGELRKVNPELSDRLKTELPELAERYRFSLPENLFTNKFIPTAPKVGEALGRASKFISEKTPSAVKTLGKGLWKSLPVLGAAATYGTARAESSSEEEALAKTVAEEVTDVLGPVKMALDPTRTGPRMGTLAERLESGTITPEERQQLLEEQQDLLSRYSSEKQKAEQITDFIKEPERLVRVSERAKAMPDSPSKEKLLESLSRASTANSTERGQIMYNLYQQPAFRQLLKGNNDE